MDQPTTIDLFAGAGGLTEGFRAAGFQPLFANEHEGPAHDTFLLNHPGVKVSGDDVESLDATALREDLGLKKGDLSVLLGGPPCQGFSTYGRRDPDDPRNRLPEEYLRFLAAFLPRAFVLENVMGLLSIQGGQLLAHIQQVAHRLSYKTEVFRLNAADYGVPQFRKRVFVVGYRDGGAPTFPPPTHHARTDAEAGQSSLFGAVSEPAPHLSVRDGIGDLEHADPLPPKETQEAIPYPPNGRLGTYQSTMRQGASELHHHSVKRMLGIRRLRLALLRPGDYGTTLRKRLESDGLPDAVIKEMLDGGAATRPVEECRTEDREKEAKLRKLLRQGRVDIDEVLRTLDAGGFANKYRRLKWTEPSHTLVAHMARDCSDFVHPDQDRFISVRESARLQSFPDRYRFAGSQFRQFRQIGNAVPPLLAQELAVTIAADLA